MKVLIASTTVPHVAGGGSLIARWTAEAMRAEGHQVEEFYLPFPTEPRHVLSAMVGLRSMPFSGSADRLLAIRWPAHVIRHENKATWFIHHFRQVFDLWDTPFRGVPDNAEGMAFRESLRRIDNMALSESRALFSNSLIVRDRLRHYNELEAVPLFPPLGGDTSRFRTDEYGDFIFYPSRLTPIKRQLLAIRAMRHTTTPVRLVIAGRPDVASFGTEIEDYVRRQGLEDRVDLRLGWMPEEEKVDLLARCLAVAYLPRDEDSYGYPSLEASHSAKAIVTLSDSGGALEFVRDGVEGLVTEPGAKALAAAFDQLYLDRDAAERMGRNSHDRRDELGINWPNTIARLLGDGA